MTYEFYTDGAATMRQVGGAYIREAGGWAWAMVDNDEVLHSDSGYEPSTTNQAMELRAIYEALEYFMVNYYVNSSGNVINIYSDSAYCINIYTQWRYGWQRNEWKRKGNKPIENLEIIKKTSELIDIISKGFSSVNFIKVAGHSGEKWNEYVDRLAVNTKTTGAATTVTYPCGRKLEPTKI